MADAAFPLLASCLFIFKVPEDQQLEILLWNYPNTDRDFISFHFISSIIRKIKVIVLQHVVPLIEGSFSCRLHNPVPLPLHFLSLGFIFNQHVKPYYNMRYMAPGAEPSDKVLKVQSLWTPMEICFIKKHSADILVHLAQVDCFILHNIITQHIVYLSFNTCVAFICSVVMSPILGHETLAKGSTHCWWY